VSGEARTKESIVATPRYKTHGTDWWTPPENTPLNAGVPYVVQIVEDALSLTEWRVLKLLTNTNDGTAKKQRDPRTERDGYVCDPGGYSQIAKRVGICRKTARNAIKSLLKKGVIQIWEIAMKGQQRIKTVYFALHYGDVLKGWRANSELFKTDLQRVVVRTRRKKLMTLKDAAEYKIDAKRAPKRGSGRGLSETLQEKIAGKTAPAPEPLPSDEDLNVIREAFLKCCPSTLKDAIDLLRIARAEARRMGVEAIPAAVVASLMLRIAHDYKPTPKWPTPRPGWFLQEIVGLVADWVKWSAQARAPDTRAG
jgi:DNA-binding Lrp family transcriptional regulator